jgi:predicted porin
MLLAPAARAVDIQSGDWKVAVNGYANAYEQMAFCNHGSVTVQGGFACQTPPSVSSRSGIQNGLGVGHFGVSASTVKDGWTLGGTGEIWSGILGGDGFSETTDFKSQGPSLRQSYVYFGNGIGTFKVGRMFGVFGSDAIANDMTLNGVGSAAVRGGGNSSLGRIGVGYVFAGFFNQIQYTTPGFSGLSLTGSVIQAFTDSSTTLTEHPVPGFMAKANYGWKGVVGGNAWTSGFLQSSTTPDGRTSLTNSAVDVGARLDYSDLSLVGYFFTGKGVGTAGLLVGGIYSPAASEPVARTTKGYFGQLTYQIANLKLGASYGASGQDLAAGERGDTLLKSNSSIIGGAYYTLGGVVTLATEWTHTISRNQAGGSVADNSLALGASAGF